MNINGNEFSWASVEGRFNGSLLTAIKAIKYSDEIDGAEQVYGAGRLPRGRTAGRYKVGDCSVTFYLSGWSQFLAEQPNGYTDVRGTFTVSYREGDDIHTDVLEDVRLLGADQSTEEGSDPSEVEVKLSVMRIAHNGVYLVAAPGE
jgi:hypothetical protein